MRLFSKSTADQPFVIAATVAQDLNDELTIIRCGAAELVRLNEPFFEEDDPGFRVLIEIDMAAKRMAWKVSQLLQYSGTKGLLSGPASLDRLCKEAKH